MAARGVNAVRLYTPGDRVEWWLNGAKVGEAAVTPADKLRAEIKVAYAPGTLEAIAYKSGKVISAYKLVPKPGGGSQRVPFNPDRAESSSAAPRSTQTG